MNERHAAHASTWPRHGCEACWRSTWRWPPQVPLVIVNTVVLVQGQLGRTQKSTALALAAYGAGSMLVALSLPKLLEKLPDRGVMLAGASLLTLGMFAGPAWGGHYESLLVLWFILGIGSSLVQTPSGRLLRRSGQQEDRPALFAAQFALSHACWLLTYPVAGWVGAAWGLSVSFFVLGAVGLAAVLAAHRVWPRVDPDEIEHRHDDLAPDHQHLRDLPAPAGRHSHPYVIDDEHLRWPS